MRDKNKKRIVEFIEGLTILAKYDEKGFSVSAEHDILYAGPGHAEAVSTEDRLALEDLGWHVDSETDSWAKFS